MSVLGVRQKWAALVKVATTEMLFDFIVIDVAKKQLYTITMVKNCAKIAS